MVSVSKSSFSLFFFISLNILSIDFFPFIFFCVCIILCVLSVMAEAFPHVWCCELFIVKHEAPLGGLGGLVNRGAVGWVAAGLLCKALPNVIILMTFLQSRLISQEESSVVSWQGGGHMPHP